MGMRVVRPDGGKDCSVTERGCVNSLNPGFEARRCVSFSPKLSSHVTHLPRQREWDAERAVRHEERGPAEVEHHERRHA